jgi:hypothetical protein
MTGKQLFQIGWGYVIVAGYAVYDDMETVLREAQTIE